MSIIAGNMIGSYSQIGKTFILTDEAGNEYTGVVTDNEVIFTATDNDVRENMVYASDNGVSTGSKVIPAYHTSHGTKIVPNGGAFKIELLHLDKYDYTIFHGIVCEYNTNLSNSVAATHISVLNEVYPVQSTDSIAPVTKDHNTKNINLGFTNNTGKMCILRYITYKEIE